MEIDKSFLRFIGMFLILIAFLSIGECIDHYYTHKEKMKQIEFGGPAASCSTVRSYN